MASSACGRAPPPRTLSRAAFPVLGPRPPATPTTPACASREARTPSRPDCAPPPPRWSRRAPRFPSPLPASQARVPAFPAGDGWRRQEERAAPRQPGPCSLGCSKPAGTKAARTARDAAGSGVRPKSKPKPESVASEPGANEPHTPRNPGGVRVVGLGAPGLRSVGAQGGGGRVPCCLLRAYVGTSQLRGTKLIARKARVHRGSARSSLLRQAHGHSCHRRAPPHLTGGLTPRFSPR